MNVLAIGRGVAVLISVATFVFLFLHDSFRADNIFLVPDLILCALLLVAAALPARIATPALIFMFGASAGVFTTSVSSYVVRGELGIASLLGVIVCLAMAAALSTPRAARGRLERVA